jgi:hypothetical protein
MLQKKYINYYFIYKIYRIRYENKIIKNIKKKKTTKRNFDNFAVTKNQMDTKCRKQITETVNKSLTYKNTDGKIYQ